MGTRNGLAATTSCMRGACCFLSMASMLFQGQGRADDGTEFVQVENALLKTIESTRLAAEVAGKIEQLTVVEGDRVVVDQPLGKIRDTAVRLQMERAQIAMARARKKQRSDIDLRLANKRWEVANNELERAESANARIANTYDPKVIDRLQLVADSTLLEIERAQHDLEVSELDVRVAENEFQQAEHLLERHQIQSPAVGVVVSINKRIGEWVEPGTELLEIVRIDRLRIEGFIAATALGKQLVGRQANVTVLRGGEERKILGKVVFVSPDANPVNGQVRIFLEIDNHEGEFRPGMRVKAFIPIDTNSRQVSSNGSSSNKIEQARP
jgi:RND family efflux transporter MFP subunit